MSCLLALLYVNLLVWFSTYFSVCLICPLFRSNGQFVHYFGCMDSLSIISVVWTVCPLFRLCGQFVHYFGCVDSLSIISIVWTVCPFTWIAPSSGRAWTGREHWTPASSPVASFTYLMSQKEVLIVLTLILKNILTHSVYKTRTNIQIFQFSFIAIVYPSNR